MDKNVQKQDDRQPHQQDPQPQKPPHPQPPHPQQAKQQFDQQVPPKGPGKQNLESDRSDEESGRPVQLDEGGKQSGQPGRNIAK
jgi:hypothetical protein